VGLWRTSTVSCSSLSSSKTSRTLSAKENPARRTPIKVRSLASPVQQQAWRALWGRPPVMRTSELAG